MSSHKTVLHGIQYASMSTKNILSMQSSEEINYTVVHAQALACTFTLTHKHKNKEGGRTSFGVPFSDGNHLFGVLLSDGNHCKRMPKFMTLGINLNRRGVVTWMTIDQVNVYCKRQHIVIKLSFHLEVSKKQTRLRAVVPRRRRYIFPCIITPTWLN